MGTRSSDVGALATGTSWRTLRLAAPALCFSLALFCCWQPLAAAEPAPADEEAPASSEWLEVLEPRGATVQISQEGKRLQVASPSGIGRFQLRRKGAAWPQPLVLLIDIRGMEGFSVATDEFIISCWLSGDGTPPGHREMQQRDAASGKWREVKEFAPEHRISCRRVGKLVEVTLPPAALQPNVDLLKISWVDFYRG